MDVAFSRNSNGKLVFAPDSTGSPYLDDRGVYAVFATLAAAKGRYGWDSTVGTFFSKLTKDGRLTSTKLSSAATDAFEQCRQDGLIAPGATALPERIDAGKWALLLRWKTPSGAAVAERGAV